MFCLTRVEEKNGKNVKNTLAKSILAQRKNKRKKNSNRKKYVHLKWFGRRKMRKTKCVCMCGSCCHEKLDEFQVALARKTLVMY